MPCPYFEPQQVAAVPANENARLPLIDEYDGLCRAVAAPVAVPLELRFRCCNQGNSRGTCGHFPIEEKVSALRYEVLHLSPISIEVLLLEERDYAPHAWQQISCAIGNQGLEAPPAIAADHMDICKRAQMLAFCRSYLRRFGAKS